MAQKWPLYSQKDANTVLVAPIQHMRINHTPTDAEVTAGFFQLEVTLPRPYPDNSYTVLITLELASDTVEGLDMPEPLVFTCIGTGFNIQQKLPAAVDTDDVFNYHILVLYEA